MDQKRKRILVAVDGSEQAQSAVAYAGRMFPSDASEITLFHVEPQIPETLWDMERSSEWRSKLAPLRAWEAQQSRDMETFIEKARTGLYAEGYSDAAVAVKSAPKKAGIARDIIAESLKDYDAVVAGRVGASAVQDILMGGTANKLIHNVHHVPVVLVGGSPNTGKLLIGFDGSEGAMKAIERIGALVAAGKAGVTICCVIRGLNSLYQRYGHVFDDKQETEWVADQKLWLSPKLTQAEESLYNLGVSKQRVARMILPNQTSRAVALVKLAREENYGSIGLGRRGISKVEEFVMGRVSKKVTQMAADRAVWLVS